MLHQGAPLQHSSRRAAATAINQHVLNNLGSHRHHPRSRPSLPQASSTTLAVAVLADVASKAENTITVYYRSQAGNWKEAVLHGSLQGGPWQDYRLSRVPSGAKWFFGAITAAPGMPVEFEFVANNRQNVWEKASGGGNYSITAAGTYAVQHGTVAKVSGKRVMVVSDLDGTMIGDDAATGAFKAFWEDKAVPRGGVLVFNTGRALDSFLQLQKDKVHCLAHPDALISAVGTKVYDFDGQQWNEDKQWSGMLDRDWNINVAREACYKALAEASKELMHFRPASEQNEHKVTCGVAVAALPRVLASVEDSLAAGSVKANLITSGSGDWRFLDIVPTSAGKLQALNYVRNRYGFEVEATVACGDSGNDILMLAGANPALVVGNAQPDLRQWVDQQEPGGGAGPGGKKRLYVAGKHEALGILEGLEYWGYL